MDDMNYITLNKMKVNNLVHIFKNEIDKTSVKFVQSHFDNYCYETSELYADICGLGEIENSQLEGFTKRLFELHLFQLIKQIRKGIKNNIDPSVIEYIFDKFIFINFGAFISKEFIIESLIKDFDDNAFLSQFPSIKPYIKQSAEPEILLDYSDVSAREKIIFLHKLGVLDFLKTKSSFLASTNKMAVYLSAVTGVKSTTIQSYINPIFSDKVDSKNNPLESPNSVTNVEQKLINMGLNNSDFM